MSNENEREQELPLVHITGVSDDLGKILLNNQCVAYHDDEFEVTSGNHEIIMKLIQKEDALFLLYVHVPYAYPIPEGVKLKVISALEAVLQKKIQKINFINAGTESQKKDIQFMMEFGDEINES